MTGFDPWGKEPEDADDSVAETVAGRSWLPIDLDETVEGLLAGTLTRPAPTIGRMPDGRCLFYPGRVNGIHGDSTAAKTWTALVTCREQLGAGEHVVYIDLEDDEIGIVGRLLDLQVPGDQITERFHYIRPAENLDRIARQLLLDTVAEVAPSLVVIDTTGEALALDGVNPNADEEVAGWMRRAARSIADLGPAVLLLDHIPKNTDGSTPLQPIGSQRKRSAITGAQYAQDSRVPFSQDQTGLARLRCGKDRGGNYPTGEHVADLHIGPDIHAVAELRGPTPDNTKFRPTVLMERISRYLEEYPGASWYAIRQCVKGKTDSKQRALQVLIDEGYLSTEPGARGSTKHTVLATFRDEGTGHPPPESRDLSPVLREGTGGQVTSPVPGTGGGTGGDRSPDSACQECAGRRGGHAPGCPRARGGGPS